jgi:hypothetical protein
VSWVKAHDGEIPPGALRGGRNAEDKPLYVGRAKHGDSLALGKVRQGSQEGFNEMSSILADQ